MANRVTVWWQGEEYDAVRKQAESTPATGPTWQLLHDGAPLTSFAAEPDESAGSIKEKIFGWLEANRTRPALDVGRQ
jgi:hypothetical protein